MWLLAGASSNPATVDHICCVMCRDGMVTHHYTWGDCSLASKVDEDFTQSEFPGAIEWVLTRKSWDSLCKKKKITTGRKLFGASCFLLILDK